jgi:hypothetical protein
MAINLYDVHGRESREKAHAHYISAPGYPALAEKAAERGYRHASIAEIKASAERAPFALDLFCWQGGLWVAI